MGYGSARTLGAGPAPIEDSGRSVQMPNGVRAVQPLVPAYNAVRPPSVPAMTDLASPATEQSVMRRHKLTVEDFHKLGEAGVLLADSRVELFEGELVDMAPIGDWHAGVVAILTEVFVKGAVDTLVWGQGPVRFADDTELQPDVAILRRRADFYRSGTPQPADVLLLIEVADSTLAYDRGPKLDLYARHGIREVWIVNLRDRCLEVFRDPSPQGYRERFLHGSGDTAVAVGVPHIEVDVGALF